MTEPLSILVLDDDWATLHFFERFLVSQGHTVSTIENPLQAMQVLAEKKFDLVFLDLSMPQMNGMEFLQNIREAGNDIPVLIITGSSSVDSVMTAVEHGISGYLIKPFTIDELARAIERVTQTSSVD
jgi:DNA-binding NtrC family response regulator